MIHIRKFNHFKYPYHNLIGIGDRVYGKTIYKYMSVKTALACLKNNTIRFSTPDNWSDPFEKYYYTANYTNVMPKNAFETRLFACCLTQQPDCEAAWKMYTKDAEKDPCLQFKICIGQFRRHVEKFVKDFNGVLYEGPVNYDMNDKEILHLYQRGNTNYPYVFNDFSIEKYLNLMILKRKFYTYEGEIRYMIQGEKLDYDTKYLDVTIPWSLCLYSIKLPPNCPENVKSELQDAISENYRLCLERYPGWYPQKTPQVENSLYAPLNSIKIE